MQLFLIHPAELSLHPLNDQYQVQHEVATVGQRLDGGRHTRAVNRALFVGSRMPSNEVS